MNVENIIDQCCTKIISFAGSVVNLIVGCKLFKAFLKTLRSNVECHERIV